VIKKILTEQKVKKPAMSADISVPRTKITRLNARNAAYSLVEKNSISTIREIPKAKRRTCTPPEITE
jgi:hypothetical protein